MQIEHAVFTSLKSARGQGYHLVAQSPGIGEAFLRLLTTWGPSHASLLGEEPTFASLNFHPLIDDWHALSRTTYGGPEYSGRGGLQIFTHFLACQSSDLEGYENNPLALAQTATTLGYLRLQPNVSPQLPVLDLPDHPLPGSRPRSSTPVATVPEVLRVLRFNHRVALIGQVDPLPALVQILRDTPREDRLQLSFTTGLKPSVHRAFRLHFLPSADTSLRAQLTAQGIGTVTVE